MVSPVTNSADLFISQDVRKNDYSFYEPYEYAWYWQAPRSMIFSMYAIAAAELDDVTHAQEYFDLSYIDMKAPYHVFFELMENASSGGIMQCTHAPNPPQ